MSEHGPPPDVSSDEWEQWAETVLDETEFDTELGKRVGRDARRVTAGDLSPEEFQERYHEDLLEEFETDQRPTTPMPGSPDPGCGDGGCGASDGTDDASRRTVLKAAGAAGLAAVGLSAVNYSATAVADGDDTGGEPDKRAGMVIDTERCIACLQCMQACNEENNTSDGSLWSYVFRYQQDDYTDQEYYLSRPCQHCSNAPCINACPTASRFKRQEDGIVLTDYDRCTGCRYCEVSCPYGVNYLQWVEQNEFDGDREVDGRTVAGDPPRGVMGKCTFCIHRQVSDDEDLRGTTACEEVCPVDAIHFGDLEDPDSDPRQHLEEKREASKFRMLEDANTRPNVIYIGNEPKMTYLERVDGPTTVEDAGLTMERPGRSVHDDGGEDDGE